MNQSTPDVAARETIAQLAKLNASGELDLPLPGHGETWRRWSSLHRWGRRDLALARLAEGHTDACAILAEAGRRPVPDALYGVWAARSGPGIWLVDGSLSGTVRFCSGAGGLDRALVVADSDPGTQLIEVVLSDGRVRPVPGSWQPLGMAASDSADVQFTGLPVDRSDLIGPPGFYTGRVGFWRGGAGVATVWLGGAAGVLDAAHGWFADHPPDDHQLAHLGALHVAAAGAEALLEKTAAAIDEDPTSTHRPGVVAARAASEHTARVTVDVAPRLFGSTGLCRDGRISQQLADLTVFIRQHHGERELAAIGRHRLDDANARAGQ